MYFGLLYFCVVILCVNRSRSSFILYRIVKRHSRQSNVRRIWTCADNGQVIQACVHGSTNGTNGRPISFKVLPMVPLVIPLVQMVPLVKTDGSQYCRQSTV